MRKRFECEHNWIIDNNKRKTNESLIVYDEEWNTLDDLCELLNQQDNCIAELEEQLKNAIVPKFKIGQEVYTIRHNNYIYNTRIDEIKIVGINGKNEIFYYYDQPGSYAHCEETEDNLFATKEEAEAKLQELKGE